MALLRIIAFLTLIGACQCSPPNCSYWKLWEYLNLTSSNDYVANVRPVDVWRKPTLVSIDLVLYGILKVDEKCQTVEGATWTSVSWTNDFVNWDPADFCGLRVITVPRSKVWIPDLHIEEDVSDTSSIQASPFVNLYSNGIASATFRQTLTFTCELEINQFPFDDQSCDITFSSMSSDATVIILTTMTNGTQLTKNTVMLTQGEWELKNIKITSGSSPNAGNVTCSKLIYNVMVSRRPMLYIINFIVPLLYFLLLDLASFFINEAAGEKLSFKVTLLLSISVLLLILKDMLPSTEATMPWIANYSVGIFAMVGISVLEAMAISFLLSFEKKVKDGKQSSSNCEEDIQLEKANSKDPLVLTVSGELTKGSPPPLNAPLEVGILRRILFEMKTMREELNCAKVPKTRPRFKKLVMVIDTLFFVLYFLAVLVFLSVVYDKWLKRFFR